MRMEAVFRIEKQTDERSVYTRPLVLATTF